MKALSLECILTSQCGTSSVGRASACQAEGRRFETGVPHHFQRNILFLLLFFIVCCGGGGSSDSSPNDSNNSNPIVTSISESCEITSWNNKLRRCDLTHDGLQRYYFIYVPDNLNNEKSIPLLFALHGYGSTARNHFSYTNYIPIADQNNLIVVYPQGAPMNTAITNSSSHWNVGGWTVGSNVKDIEFIDTVIELIKNKIDLDQTRIYSSGMSNGGFMSYHLACNLSNQIAAIASVTGSMTPETFANCNPTHATPILQIHGLLDYTVPYNGLSYMESIPKVMEYWSEYNSCSSEPDESTIENISEGYVINIQEYKNCLNDVNVKLYLHSSMGHTWPRISNYGISASSEVWNFVSQYNLYGKIN